MDETDLAEYHPGTLYAIHKTVHSLKAFTFRKIKIVLPGLMLPFPSSIKVYSIQRYTQYD